MGAHVAGLLAGAIAVAYHPVTVDIDRLVVDPSAHRQGIGRALVQDVVRRAEGRMIEVSTGRDNAPARRLYESLGFRTTRDVEVLAGLWVTRYAHCP
ncbi:GNAT family N-acetyltransferase [Modestobacter marinus]|uniref:GNAT family N-acetyltransferase n=1 Tax=Modestobacter marinus TaxID=477641 RepID=UPI00227C717F|nr:GNAT family N-acetyltransferase [Modestobacter marinus]